MTHAYVGACAVAAVAGPRTPRRIWLLAPICAAFPDLDVGLFTYGVQYHDLWGHRGMMHSLIFAFALAVVIAMVVLRRFAPMFGLKWWAWVLLLFIVTASHGVLDGFTNGGLGIAYFAPFNAERYFFPWQPIEVAPIGVSRLFTQEGWLVIRSELLWVWLPATVLTACIVAIRLRVRASRAQHAHSPGS
jgi:inner membrane protein